MATSGEDFGTQAVRVGWNRTAPYRVSAMKDVELLTARDGIVFHSECGDTCEM
jgi:hypothetical protein